MPVLVLSATMEWMKRWDHFVKEYGEGVDRMCRELEVNGSITPVFHTDDFILKVTEAKVTDKLPENNGKVARKVDRKKFYQRR